MKDREVFFPAVNHRFCEELRDSCMGKCSVSRIDGIACVLRRSCMPAVEF